jgi:NADH:ubiquinone oxidoreductase subunit F (NADH-binding)
VLKALAAGNLRGMGGALFPTARKWETVRKEKSPEKYIICNADECEVGTIKDRELMKNLPYLLVEAMAIAGLVCGAEKGYIYIRHEYHDQIEILEQEIARAGTMGVIGNNVLGSGKRFDLEVFVSPGGYVQGEETALMEAIEGKRGQPRNKIVDVGLFRAAPVFNGLWGKPTVVNNVETLSLVPWIVSNGAAAFADIGDSDNPGTTLVQISGAIGTPGIVEVPLGMSLRRLLDVAGGFGVAKALLVGGPAGGFLPPAELDTLYTAAALNEKGAIWGSGSIVVAGPETCLVDMATTLERYLSDESCGKTIPCRIGVRRIYETGMRATTGLSRPTDPQILTDLAADVRDAALCGLEYCAPNPFLSGMRYFADEFDQHFTRGTCPAGVCNPVRVGSPAMTSASA